VKLALAVIQVEDGIAASYVIARPKNTVDLVTGKLVEGLPLML
jgi:hypothetical protein